MHNASAGPGDVEEKKNNEQVCLSFTTGRKNGFDICTEVNIGGF